MAVLRLMRAPAKVDCDGLDLFAAATLQRRAFDAQAWRFMARSVKGCAPGLGGGTIAEVPLQRFAVTSSH
jgi:penicillin-binding protein 1C